VSDGGVNGDGDRLVGDPGPVGLRETGRTSVRSPVLRSSRSSHNCHGSCNKVWGSVLKCIEVKTPELACIQVW
jgi:hypothetical protein